MDIWRLILFASALLVCPAVYVELVGRMREAGVARPPMFPFFFLFGTFGGWLLAFALSPSGLTAMCLVFLMTIAPVSVLSSSIYLIFRPERSVYHRVAVWGGFIYPALLGVWILGLGIFH